MGSSLKSDQNGIEMMWVPDVGSLKSDQNGIEIHYFLKYLLYDLRLKSDQNGIEIRVYTSGIYFVLRVKIRPKWD